jgi:hypothetical protein
MDIRIHITLEEDLDVAAKNRALSALMAKGLSDVNRRRFQRYGVVSGFVPYGRLKILRAVPGVKAVEADSEKRVSVPSNG